MRLSPLSVLLLVFANAVSAAELLPDPLQLRVDTLIAAGDARLTSGDMAGAIDRYRAAVDTLPAPANRWDACLDTMIALGDTHFLVGDFGTARQVLDQARGCPDANADVFLRFRLGQTNLELGDCQRAGEDLVYALAFAGPEIFEGEHPKYMAFATAPGGTPTATCTRQPVPSPASAQLR